MYIGTHGNEQKQNSNKTAQCEQQKQKCGEQKKKEDTTTSWIIHREEKGASKSAQ